MELIHCRKKSCWLQNAGPSQREGTLPDANASEILREGRTMESEASTEEPLQPEWHVYTGQERGRQPAHPGSPCCGRSKAQSCPLRCPRSPSSAAQPRLWQALRPTPTLTAGQSCSTNTPRTSSSKRGAASHGSCVPCPQLFRKKIYLVIIRNAS